MAAPIAQLRDEFRALRTLQAPEQVVFDPKVQDWRVSSAAFKPQSDGTISADLEEVQLRDKHGLTYGYPRVDRAVGLVAHKVGRLRTAGFTVNHVPVPDNDYHGQAAGTPTTGTARTSARDCEVVVPLNGDMARRLEDEKLAKNARALGIGTS